MADLWKLPPPEPARARRELPGARRLDPVAGPLGAWVERDEAARDPAAGRLVRRARMGAADAEAHIRQWRAGTPPAAPVRVRAGARAWERRRPDATLTTAWRRQRLAAGPHGDVVDLVHWSVLDPPTPQDEAAWDRAVAALVAVPERGWTA
ncbi:MAG: hypothetical protein MUE51_06825 [Thermoleophilia bacterium]|nr:hypothetical protein [Thermoleophilia bacterium]